MEYIDIFSLLIGAFFSWLITHLYQKRSNKEQKELYNKISSNMREVFLSDKREVLSVKEINDILWHKTISEKNEGLLKYKACPACGSINLSVSTNYFVDYEADDFGNPITEGYPYKVITCIDCGWEKTEDRVGDESYE